jgi:hypothetical protein
MIFRYFFYFNIFLIEKNFYKNIIHCIAIQALKNLSHTIILHHSPSQSNLYGSYIYYSNIFFQPRQNQLARFFIIINMDV